MRQNASTFLYVWSPAPQNSSASVLEQCKLIHSGFSLAVMMMMTMLTTMIATKTMMTRTSMKMRKVIKMRMSMRRDEDENGDEG